MFPPHLFCKNNVLFLVLIILKAMEISTKTAEKKLVMVTSLSQSAMVTSQSMTLML